MPDLESEDIAAPLIYFKSDEYDLDDFKTPLIYNLTVVPS